MPTNSLVNKYALSPLQQGLLFNTLYAPDSGVDIVQIVFTLYEHLRPQQFEQAWKSVFERYSVLRTAFHWDGLTEFQQEVYPSVALPLKYEDWRTVSPENRQSCLEDFIRADRQMGFNLAKPPLVRLTVCQTSDTPYYFIFTLHHIILDGRSVLILLKDAFALYDALCEEKHLDLPIEVPYRDYLAWLQYRDTTMEKEFWQQWLKGFTVPTPINNNGNLRKEADTFKDYGDQDIRLSHSVTTALKKFVEKHNLTLNTILQGAWSILLSRYSRQDDVVFGITRSCRRETIEGSATIVGLLINTLPMRVQLAPDKNLLDWLKEIRFKNRSLHEHIHTNLVQVQGCSEIPKEISLFDHIVIFENFSLHSALTSQGGKWENRKLELRRKPSYPLTVYGFDESELLIKIIYNRDFFDDNAIKRMLGHLQTLLEGMLANPNCRLADLSLLTSEERQQLLVDWNTMQFDNPRDRCIHELFEECVERTPNAIAVVFEEQYLTYKELNTRANQLAHCLSKMGVESNVLVGICMEPSLEMIIGLLGVLKAGGAYVPLNPAYPKDRLEFILEDTNVGILLTQSQIVDKLPPCFAQVISLDAELNTLRLQDDTNLTDLSTPDNLAYVIYTSGSTGQPKGVRVTHSNVTSLFCATQTWFQFDERDVWTLFHSFAFDFSVWEIWGALVHGGQLVIVPFWISRSPEAFYKLLCRKGVTILNQTPSAFYQLIQTDNTAESQILNLRWVIFGGEKLEIQNLRPWFLRHGDENPQLANMYGITETTVHVTFRPIKLQDLDKPGASMIGRPIPGWKVFLVDHYQQLAPIGIPGEIYVGGAGVSCGYLNRPELTTKRFVPNPFDHVHGKYLYRSGDLARYLPNGDIEYLGRIDQQVKIRGFRIELGEIETILRQHSAVQDCIVWMREELDRDKYLVAYVVLQTQDVSALALREFLKAKLPDHMWPTAFVFLDSLPLTSNGKLDYQALPVPDWAAVKDTTYWVAPRNSTEETIAKIWTELLHLNQLGMRDNFFELGGHSLLAAQLMARIREAFKIELSFRVLFDNPTVEGLTRAILQIQEANDHPYVTIQPAARDLHTKIDGLSDEEVETFLSEFFDDTNE